MVALERLFRIVGAAGVVCGLFVLGYGFLAPELDAIAMLAGIFTAFVGLTLLAAGVVWPRFDGSNGRRA